MLPESTTSSMIGCIVKSPIFNTSENNSSFLRTSCISDTCKNRNSITPRQDLAGLAAGSISGHRLWFWIRLPGFEFWVGANIIWSFDHCTGLIPEPSSLRGSTLGTRAAEPVTGACKLIDGCSLELCSATPSVVTSGRNEVNSTAWLSWWPRHEIGPAKFILHLE